MYKTSIENENYRSENGTFHSNNTTNHMFSSMKIFLSIDFSELIGYLDNSNSSRSPISNSLWD